MQPAPRIVAAALALAVGGLLVVALASSAGGQQLGLVTLQVAPRGPGSVSAVPTGSGDAHPCNGQQGEQDCEWRYERGTTVELTATSDGGPGESFSGWSDPDCGSSSSCTVKLDEDLTSLVAVFSPLMLGVKFSSNDPGATVTFDPAGDPCDEPPDPDDPCREFPPHTRVSLTVKPDSKQFNGWKEGGEYLCEPTSSPTCTIAVEDSPTWAGVRFEGDPEDQPSLPTTITVEFKLRKSGNGSGRLTATKLDCGTVCSTNYGYGKAISLRADADEGSLFDGWNGVCAKTQTTCTFAAGPITSIRALFTRVAAAPVARDMTAPSAPGVPFVRNKTRTSITIAWSASSDNVGVTGYRIYVNDAAAAERRETDYTLEGLRCGGSYAVAVDAVDANGNRSQRASTTIETQPCALAARLARVSVQRAGANRLVVVRLRVNRVTRARLRLARGSRTVASRRYGLRPGTNTLRLRVPRRLPRGPYRLTIGLVNPDGGTLTFPPRRVVLPRA